MRNVRKLSCLSHLVAISLFAVVLSSCEQTSSSKLTDTQIKSIKVLSPEQIDFVSLNPARGDAAPQAGMLWGDLREDVPTGMILKFADGFASPPHIHNITYRGVVINGALHNDDPEAANMWMGQGSYWMQPAGEDHITSAKPGGPATAFLEIQEGPYLVQPSDGAFDNGERPVNVDRTNLVWVPAKKMNWTSPTSSSNTVNAEISFLWGSLEPGLPSATMLKILGGDAISFKGEKTPFHAVVIAGTISHSVRDASDTTPLNAGSYFTSNPGVTHQVACKGDENCMLYIRTENRFVIE